MTAGAVAAVGLNPRILAALQELQGEPLIQRAIPKTDDLLPVVGLGSANTFSDMALEESRSEAYDTISAFRYFRGRTTRASLVWAVCRFQVSGWNRRRTV